jgi:hypothetical protein
MCLQRCGTKPKFIAADCGWNSQSTCFDFLKFYFYGGEKVLSDLQHSKGLEKTSFEVQKLRG